MVTARLLVIDLDETLVFATEKLLDREPDMHFRSYFVYKRPHLKEFLAYCFAHFDVGVWSSARKRYVSFIVGEVFGPESKLRFAWSEEECLDQEAGESRRKDLRKLKQFGYSIDEIIAIDDSPHKLELHLANLLQVSPYRGDPRDTCLLDTITSLEGRRIAP